MAMKAGVVLSGCGVFDGSEVREAVLCLLALDMEGVAFQCVAPDRPQMHVIDHLAGQPAEGQERNVLVESARIARGDIKAAGDAKGSDFDLWVFPGGFGAAKNLCDFAFKGADCQIDPDVARLLREAREAGKPLCFCCIAPALAAKALQSEGVSGAKLTVGLSSDGAAKAIEAMGQTHVEASARGFVADEANRIVSTPAYMHGDARLSEIFEGIRGAVKAAVAMASETAAAPSPGA
jgi:enhancing lycopene biosynthesis protein 2